MRAQGSQRRPGTEATAGDKECTGLDFPRPIAGALLAAALLSVLLLVVLAGGSQAADDVGRGEPAAGTFVLSPTACPTELVPGFGECVTPAPPDCFGFDVQVPTPPPFCGTTTPTPDQCVPCGFSLLIEEVNDTPLATPCNSNDGTFVNPKKCLMDNGDTFKVQIIVDAVPTAEGSYNGYQTFLAYGSLLYKPSAAAESEVFWDRSFLAVRFPQPTISGREGSVRHGNASFLFPPFPPSTQSGDDNPILELEFNCQTDPATGTPHGHTLALLPATKYQVWNGNTLTDIPNSPLFSGVAGSAFTIGDEAETVAVPPIGWMPLDLDNDGELDRYRFGQTPTATPLNTPPGTPLPTLTPTTGIVLEYPISALLQIDCGAGAPAATPLTPDPPCTPPNYSVPGGTPPQPANAAGCGTATPSNTPCLTPGKVPIPTSQNNPRGLCGTPVDTPKLPPTDTPTPTDTPLPTITPGGPTLTPTPTETPVPPTPTSTETPVPPTPTLTATSAPPTDTPTDTPVTPTDTSPPANTATETAPPPAGMDTNTGSVPAGGTLTTDKEGDGATPGDPVESAVTVPVAGVVTISEKAIILPDSSGFVFFGQQVNINAPPADSQNPMVIVFTLDASIIPSGENETTVMLFKNGALVPECLPGGKAMPDPCVAKRHKLVGPAEDDVQLIVLTSNASAWNFGVPAKPDGILLGDVNGDDEVNSLDAFWVLLRAVGAVERVPFPSVSDVNDDGLTDVVDALIILQFDAGITTELPPGAGGRPLNEGAGWLWPRPF